MSHRHELAYDAEHRQSPNYAEKPSSTGAAKADQGKRRIGSGDQQVDGGMIQVLEKTLQALFSDTVVKGGGCVKQDQPGFLLSRVTYANFGRLLGLMTL